MAIDYEEIERQFDKLPLREKLVLVERLVRRIRQTDAEPIIDDKALEAMVNDPGMQRVLRNEDLEDYKNVAG